MKVAIFALPVARHSEIKTRPRPNEPGSGSLLLGGYALCRGRKLIRLLPLREVGFGIEHFLRKLDKAGSGALPAGIFEPALAYKAVVTVLRNLRRREISLGIKLHNLVSPSLSTGKCRGEHVATVG